MARKRSSGFTLVELLVTVVLVSILAAIAIPSYSAYVVRGQRAAAKAGLEQAAQYLERNYTANGCYSRTAAADCPGQTGTPLALPASLASAPSDGPASYAIGVIFTPVPAGFSAGQYFSLTATPCGTAGTCTGSNASFTDSDCGVLSLDNTGAKDVSNNTLDKVTCWQR